MKLILMLIGPGLELTEASCCFLVHMEKQLGWAHKLGGIESLGISKVGQTMLARLMES